MNQAWYGPLVQLGDTGAHKGCHVQLVVFILQCHPPEKVKTFKGTEVVKSTLYVGDSSCLNVKVSLWNDNACHKFSAGDIIFLQNMKVAEFRGQTEVTTAQFSKLFKLIEMHDLLSCQAVESALVLCQHGPLVKEKLSQVISWAQQTQRVLISFLIRLSRNTTLQDKLHDHNVTFESFNNDGRTGNSDGLTVLEGHARKCCSIAEASSIQAPCLVEFTAKIGEMYLQCSANAPGLCLGVHNCLLFSKNLCEKGAQTILRELLCIGCETCGSPLDADHNGIYGACKCQTMSSYGASDGDRTNGRRVSRIFHPFYLHVWDQSGQATVLVRHSAALLMFANMKADKVFQSLQGESSSDTLEQKQYMDTVSDEMHSVTDKSCAGRLSYSSLLLFLLRSLLSSKNSEFHFKAVCCHSLKRQGGDLQCPLDLVSFSLPIINEFRT